MRKDIFYSEQAMIFDIKISYGKTSKSVKLSIFCYVDLPKERDVKGGKKVLPKPSQARGSTTTNTKYN